MNNMKFALAGLLVIASSAQAQLTADPLIVGTGWSLSRDHSEAYAYSSASVIVDGNNGGAFDSRSALRPFSSIPRLSDSTGLVVSPNDFGGVGQGSASAYARWLGGNTSFSGSLTAEAYPYSGLGLHAQTFWYESWSINFSSLYSYVDVIAGGLADTNLSVTSPRGEAGASVEMNLYARYGSNGDYGYSRDYLSSEWLPTSHTDISARTFSLSQRLSQSGTVDLSLQTNLIFGANLAPGEMASFVSGMAYFNPHALTFVFCAATSPECNDPNSDMFSNSLLNPNQITFSPCDSDCMGGGPIAAVPEPETYAMLLAGLGLLGWHARRRKLKEAALA